LYLLDVSSEFFGVVKYGLCEVGHNSRALTWNGVFSSFCCTKLFHTDLATTGEKLLKA